MTVNQSINTASQGAMHPLAQLHRNRFSMVGVAVYRVTPSPRKEILSRLERVAPDPRPQPRALAWKSMEDFEPRDFKTSLPFRCQGRLWSALGRRRIRCMYMYTI